MTLPSSHTTVVFLKGLIQDECLRAKVLESLIDVLKLSKIPVSILNVTFVCVCVCAKPPIGERWGCEIPVPLEAMAKLTPNPLGPGYRPSSVSTRAF